MERIIDRFDKYMKLKGLNDNLVTSQMSLSIGLLGKSRKDGRDLSKKMVESILEFYTDIEKVWFLTGVGEMLIKSNEPLIYPESETQNLITDPKVTTYSCPECVNKQKEIDYWKGKFYSLCDESREVERKYRELLEGKIEMKKETQTTTDAQAG
ncbi:MAG: hypothetical protein JNL03_01085 [Prolixibacteraceae bacterium]|nr:hypothetical protein [Prolixibacteraceae bacterium]